MFGFYSFIVLKKILNKFNIIYQYSISVQDGATELGQMQEGDTPPHTRLKSGMNVPQTAIFIASQISGLAVLVVPPLLVDSGKLSRRCK